MRLSELLQGLPVTAHGRGGKDGLEAGAAHRDPQVLGVHHDSRTLAAGDLFVAWKGQHHNASRFVGQALERGAVAVLADSPPPEPVSVPWLTVREPRTVLGTLSSRIYGHPHREMVTVGVTGTNGKSTVTALVRGMLEAQGYRCGQVGTLGYVFADHHFPAERTTPEASDLFRILRTMRDAGARAVVMEVSSHALAQGRVHGAAFDAAVFTNLSRDHFDLHPDLDDYFRTKRSLFRQLKATGRSVVNLDDPYGRRLAEELDGAVTFGDDRPAMVRIESVELDRRGCRGVLATPTGKLSFETPLLGRYNVSNVLAAVAAAQALDVSHGAMQEALRQQAPLPGRMEPVERGQPFPALIDYAHTHAALEAALRSLKEWSACKIALVFGCGGDRDPGKRPLMGRVAGEGSELPILTHDNPRSEDPQKILDAVEAGLKASGNPSYRVVPDRREAIRQAICQAETHAEVNWAVLVAGKGHEEIQILGDERRPFSDRRELEAALEERFGRATLG